MIPEDPLDELFEEGEQALDEGEIGAAQEAFEEILQRDPDHWGAALRRAECLLLQWRLEEAMRAVQELTPPEGEEDDPDRLDLEARIWEAMDRPEEAERRFALSHRLDPDTYPLPVRLTAADFQRLLTRVIRSMPAAIRQAVEEVPVVVEPKPTPELAGREPHLSPEILGLFVGTPVGERLEAPSGYGNVVMLFQRNLERAGRNRADVEREVRITLLHEFAHYLGFDEEDMERLGLA